MERRYICANGVVERTRYAVGDNAHARGKRKKGNTSFRKQESNFNSALRRLARILNCNYTHENGLLITLDYDRPGLERLIGKLGAEAQEAIRALALPKGTVGNWQKVRKSTKGNGRPMAAPTSAESGDVSEALEELRTAAEHELTLWMRRVKRKSGVKIKTVSVTADIDGDTGELVRVHHHAVFAAQGLSWDILREEWKNGSLDIRQLRDQKDYTPVAVYLLAQVRRQPDKKKYRVSRGMEVPETEEREILSHTEIKAPVGAILLEKSAFEPDMLGQYIRYIPKERAYRKKSALQERGQGHGYPCPGEDVEGGGK